MKSRYLTVLVLATALAGPVSVARAASDEAPADTIERGAQLVIDGLRAFFASIPQYEPPEVLPNGDIIIRRVKPDAPKQDEKKDGDDGNKGLKL
ncbi:MAG: hypothetical protein JJ959_14580 [Nisaea sp.]|uniref:hypothetical protein n=1 Tax=Nisaea sp. TaxID=2024842 RepID=UPI001B2D4184|nr:hypothetical protein [Nisaea sp.]MBO6561766.1 hypothetical protein [Nisaea sp.]